MYFMLLLYVVCSFSAYNPNSLSCHVSNVAVCVGLFCEFFVIAAVAGCTDD